MKKIVCTTVFLFFVSCAGTSTNQYKYQANIDGLFNRYSDISIEDAIAKSVEACKATIFTFIKSRNCEDPQKAKGFLNYFNPENKKLYLDKYKKVISKEIVNTRWSIVMGAIPYEIIFLENGQCETTLGGECTWGIAGESVKSIINISSHKKWPGLYNSFYFILLNENDSLVNNIFGSATTLDATNLSLNGQFLEKNNNIISKKFKNEYERYTAQCEYIGFKRGTDKMGECVLKIKETEIKIAQSNAQIASSKAQERSADSANTLNNVILLNEALKLMNPPRQNFNCQARPFGIYTNIYCN